jgi:uncharacterized cofD-like protein
MNRASDDLVGKIKTFLKSFRGFLIPGIGIKRWLVIIVLGTTLIGVGLGVVILEVYRNAPETWWLPILSAASLRVLPRIVRALIFGGLGIGLVAYGIWELNRTIVRPYLRPGESVVDTLRAHRQRDRGPKVVVIGGGHGLSALLRGMKAYTYNLTAVVSVADDGGSSGKLRKELGILPPGDLRNCLTALSDEEALLGQLFQYRFSQDGGLQGHSFGNLLISALADITGSFEQAVVESGKVLSVRGQVLPATLHDVHLEADIILPHTITEVRVQGESEIPKRFGRIRRVWLEPDNPPAFPKVIQAILAADLILIGPGSLYTSILPNLLVPDVAAAIRTSRAMKIYICNITTQPGETDGFDGYDHVNTLIEHVGEGLFGTVLCNSAFEQPISEGMDWIRIGRLEETGFEVFSGDLVDARNPGRHDSQKLGKLVMELLQEKTGPLVE